MAQSFRRVVTGHNAQGKSIFTADGPAPSVHVRGNGRTTATDVWETRGSPADNSGDNDPTMDRDFHLPPPKNGTVFRIVEYPPDSQRLASMKEPAVAHDSKAEGYVRDFANVRHPGFHKTSSVDYAIVLTGEIYALVDEGEVLLKTGDILIQRGTSHAWSNRTNEPSAVAFVLIDADPV